MINEECFIYKFQEDDIFNIDIFQKINKLEIYLLSFKEPLTDEILEQFYGKI